MTTDIGRSGADPDGSGTGDDGVGDDPGPTPDRTETPVDAGWASFLDSLESELIAVQRVANERRRPAPPFVPPDDLGPLPRDLAARASAVLAQLQDVTEQVRADVARTGRQLRELRELDHRGPRPASSFDTKA